MGPGGRGWARWDPAVAVTGGSPGPGVDGRTQRSFLSPTQPSPNMATGPVLPRSVRRRGASQLGGRALCSGSGSGASRSHQTLAGGAATVGGGWGGWQGQSPPGFLWGPPCRFQEPRAGVAGFPRVLDGQESAYNVGGRNQTPGG